ncbi:MAG: hypothetical protein LBL92_02385 [Propionibacteriaceae bacterium]|nr:hypothetical protein [Propionibacteriaceae bacterium]
MAVAIARAVGIGAMLLFLAVAIHEFGHMIGGWINGRRLSQISVLGLTLRRVKSRWRVSWERYWGFCLMAPKRVDSPPRYLAHYLGGPIASFVVGVAGFIVVWLVDLPAFARPVILWFGLICLMASVGSAFPVKNRANADILMVFDLARHPDGPAMAWRQAFFADALWQCERFREMPDVMFGPTSSTASGEGTVAEMRRLLDLMNTLRLNDLGDRDAASHTMRAVVETTPDSEMTETLLSELLINQLAFGVDSGIPDLLEQITTLQATGQDDGPESCRVRAAVAAYVDDDPEAADHFLDQAEQQLATENLPCAIALYEEDQIHALRLKINDQDVGSDWSRQTHPRGKR